MKNKIFSVFVIFFFLAVFFVFYKGLQNSTIYSPDISLKKNIPFFKTKIFQSQKIVTSEEIFINNKFYLLNIWASWCIPCKEEHPFLFKLSDISDLELVGLNYKDKNKNANKFLKELGDPYDLILSDQDGTISIEWGAYGVPESFLIYNKKVIKKIIGPITSKSFLELKRTIK